MNAIIPVLQSRANRIVDGVEDCDLSLETHVSLHMQCHRLNLLI